KELDRRNLKYVRYADDFSIYTKSKREARKVGNEIFYWESNKKKDQAWDLIESYIKNTREKFIQDRLILLVISAWAKKPFFEEKRLPILEELTRYQPQL